MIIAQNISTEGRKLELTNRIIRSDGSLWGWRFALTSKFASPETNVVFDVPYDESEGNCQLESYVGLITLPRADDARKMGASAPTLSLEELCTSLPEFIHAVNAKNTLQHVHSANPKFFGGIIKNLMNTIYESDMERKIPHMKIFSVDVWENSVVLKMGGWTHKENPLITYENFQEAFDACGIKDYKLSTLKCLTTDKIHICHVMAVFTAKSIVPAIERTRKYLGTKKTYVLNVPYVSVAPGLDFSCSEKAAEYCSQISMPDKLEVGYVSAKSAERPSFDYVPIDGCDNTFMEVIRIKSATFIEKHAQGLLSTIDHIIDNVALVKEVLATQPKKDFDEVKNVGFNHYVATAKLGFVDETWPFPPEVTNETLKQEIEEIGSILDLPNPPSFIIPVDKVTAKLEIVDNALFLCFNVYIRDRKK